MRVLVVHNRYREAGGEDTVARGEVALLRAGGHQVAYLETANPDGPVGAGLALATAPWNVAAARRVTAAAQRMRAEVVHVHNTWFRLSPAVLHHLHAARLPVVVTLHNYRTVCLNGLLYRDGQHCTDCIGRLPLPGVRHGCYRGSRGASAVAATTVALHRVARTWSDDVDVLCAVSGHARELLIAGGLPAERIVVHGNHVTDLGVRAAPPSSSSVVAFVGRLSEEKGVVDLVAAWDAAPAGLELHVVGDGPARPAVERRAGHAVRVLGLRPRGEVRRLLRRARALVVPSRWVEGQPLAVLEAFEAGTPVLGSDLGAVGELVRALDPAWAVPTGGWVDRLGLLADGAHVDAVGHRARDRYEAEHSPEAARGRLERIYGLAREARA